MHHRLTPIEAARLGRALEPHHLFWMEDPTPAEDQERFRLIRQHTTTPLAVGEVFNSIFDGHRLIEDNSSTTSGPASRTRAASATSGRLRAWPRCTRCAGSHGATDLSPVSLAAALHVDLSVHNFGIQEYMPHAPETDRVFPHAYTFEAGMMHPGEAPGLGVDIDEGAAAAFPYRRAYLPGGAPCGRHRPRLVGRRCLRAVETVAAA